MRRLLSVVALLLALTLGVPLGAAGQATPDAEAANPFADLGLPQLDITVTDTAFDGLPSALDAGRYVVSLTNEASSEAPEGGTFMLLPEDVTYEDFMALTAPPPATPAGAEVDAGDASPVADEGGDAPPEWYYQVAIAGGPYAEPGQTTYAVIDLAAGEWVFWAEYPGAPQAPVAITVSGELSLDLPVPTADVTVTMTDFAFSFSGPVPSGSLVIEAANTGNQPHFIGLGTVPAGSTADEVLAAFESAFGDPMASPVAAAEGALSFEDIEEGWGSGDQSGGTTAWYAIDLEAGTHVAVCFVTDPVTGLPHAMLGMIEVFEVE